MSRLLLDANVLLDVTSRGMKSLLFHLGLQPPATEPPQPPPALEEIPDHVPLTEAEVRAALHGLPRRSTANITLRRVAAALDVCDEAMGIAAVERYLTRLGAHPLQLSPTPDQA